MPKAKVNNNSVPVAPSSANRTPVKINSSGTPKWYMALMFACWIVGLAWLVVNYLAGPQIQFMQELGAWNYGIGFAFIIVGLLMTTAWR